MTLLQWLGLGHLLVIVGVMSAMIYKEDVPDGTARERWVCLFALWFWEFTLISLPFFHYIERKWAAEKEAASTVDLVFADTRDRKSHEAHLTEMAEKTLKLALRFYVRVGRTEPKKIEAIRKELMNRAAERSLIKG